MFIVFCAVYLNKISTAWFPNHSSLYLSRITWHWPVTYITGFHVIYEEECVIYVISANKRGIYDHKINIFWMNIYWRIQKPGYVINYDVVRSKNMVCILLSRSQNSIFARKKSKNLHFWRNFVTGGENLHFWRISSFSASDEFLSACVLCEKN